MFWSDDVKNSPLYLLQNHIKLIKYWTTDFEKTWEYSKMFEEPFPVSKYQ